MKEINIASGEKLIVRRPMIEDAEKMIDYLNMIGGESDFLLIEENGCKFTVEQEKDFIRSILEDQSSVMYVGFIDEELVAIANLSTSKSKRLAHNTELGISVAQKYWGKGIGSIMMNEVIEFAETSDQIKIINLRVHGENERAIRTYKKLGFEEIGRYKDYFHIKGEFHDAVLMNKYL